MATPLLVAQQIFTALTSGNFPASSLSNGTASNSTIFSSQSGRPATLPSDLTSLITFLISFSALRDWVKLFVIGSALETVRRLGMYSYRTFQNSLFINAQFTIGDATYDWMIVWLSKQPSWKKAREVQVTTRTYGLSASRNPYADPSDPTYDSEHLSYIPGVDSVHTMWFKGHWVRIVRSIVEGDYGRKDSVLNVTIFAFSQKVLNQLLIEAKRVHKESKENVVSIFVSGQSNEWRLLASRPKRPLSSIVLDPGIKDILLDDARDFLASKNWYLARGIPFRRGYLLYGAPGSGKTSIIHSLAGELDLDVYVVSLSRAGLDDTSLSQLVSDLPARCIALMEDIDAAFSQTLNRDDDNEGKQGQQGEQLPLQRPKQTTSRISLSGLLNALDGVGAQEGRILFATTNKYEALDAALIRPGRMDIHIEFKLASKYQAKELYRCFYLPESEEKKEKDKEETEAVEVKEEGKPPATDSGYVSGSDEKADPLVPEAPAITVTEGAAFHGSSHGKRGPRLSKEQVDVLAAEFAERIPQREFSMAALQGYLMSYKIRPLEAIKDVEGWAEKERAEAARQKAKCVDEERKDDKEKEKGKEKDGVKEEKLGT